MELVSGKCQAGLHRKLVGGQDVSRQQQTVTSRVATDSTFLLLGLDCPLTPLLGRSGWGTSSKDWLKVYPERNRGVRDVRGGKSLSLGRNAGGGV